jgi:hypothetical protein
MEVRTRPAPVETDHPGNPNAERARAQAPAHAFEVLFEAFPL